MQSCGSAPTLQVLSSSSATKGPSGTTYTRLFVGQDFILAAVFDGLDGHRYREGPAAQFCAYHCFEEYSRIASSSAGLKLEEVLTQTLRQLDLLYLKSADVALQVHANVLPIPGRASCTTLPFAGNPAWAHRCMHKWCPLVQPVPASSRHSTGIINNVCCMGWLVQDRLECGCTAALLHLDLRTHVVTAAALGACAVVAGQRRGGLASATSTPLRLCGGTATRSAGNAATACLVYRPHTRDTRPATAR